MPASLPGLFSGLIGSLASDHSFLFEELSVRLGSRPKSALGQQEKGKIYKGRVSSPLGSGDHLRLLFSSNSPD